VVASESSILGLSFALGHGENSAEKNIFFFTETKTGKADSVHRKKLEIWSDDAFSSSNSMLEKAT